MRVIGYYISSNGIIANSDNEVTTKPPYLDFLLQPKPDSIRVLYYLVQNITSLAKITKMNMKEISQLHNQTHGKCYLPPYKLQYIPHRFLLLQKGYYKNNPFAYYYDAHQYKNVQAEDCTTEEDCIVKAKEAQKIGEEVRNSLNELGLHPKGLTSPINLFDKEVISKYNLPKEQDTPEIAGFYAYNCCKGNWLEAFQTGHWDITWNYDLSSAYPFQIMNLLDIRQGKWINSKQFIEEATYGYCRGEVTINAEFSPILYKNILKDKTNLEPVVPVTHTPVGTWKTFLTKKEIEFINKWELGKFKIEDGWWWIANQKEVNKPLNGLIYSLYLKKEALGKTINKEIIKRIMAGIYGKFLEARNKTLGNRFNSVWAAEVETNARLEVADFVLRNNAVQDLIHIAVDGIILSKPILLQENGIGKWRLDNVSPCISVGTGQVALRDQENGDFHLNYDWLKRAIEAEPENNEYIMKSIKPVTLAEVINDKKLDRLGELQEVQKYIDIGRTDKRCYKERPNNGKKLLSMTYSSLSLDISLLQKIQEV